MFGSPAWSSAREAVWRADFFDNIDDEQPTRFTVIDAATKDEAADKAIAQMGNSMSVNLVRTVPA